MQKVSQHDKFRPIIRETIAELKNAKAFERFKSLTDGVKLHTKKDVRGKYECTLDEAKEKKLITLVAKNPWHRAFESGEEPHIPLAGNDGAMYQAAWVEGVQKLYQLQIDGVAVKSELWPLLGGTTYFSSAEKMLSAIMNEETPTFELGKTLPIIEESLHFSDLKWLLPVEKRGEWEALGVAFANALQKRGYLSDALISSWQEHTLAGSTTSYEYSEHPYKPLGVIHLMRKLGQVGLREVGNAQASLARELAVFTVAHHKYYGIRSGGKSLPVFLEPLGADGNTIRDPRAIDNGRLTEALKKHPLERAIEECLVPGTVKSVDFPNRRD